MANNMIAKHMPVEIDLYSYISVNNASGVKKLAFDEGYKSAPVNAMQGAMILRDIVKSEKEEGLKKVAMIHPDRDLILATVKGATKGSNTMEQTQMNLFSADGEEEKKGLSEKTMNVIIISGAVILGLTLITVIATK